MRIAGRGARVVAVDRKESDVSALADEISAETGVGTRGLICDISQPAAVSELAERIEREFGQADILVNNAASKGGNLPAFFEAVESYSLDTWNEVMGVNLTGLFLCARAFGSRMASRGHGSIINIASIYGVVGADARIYEGSNFLGQQISTPPVYSASKAGVIGLTRHLACHWAARGVRVNCVTPGGVKSGQNDEFISRYSARVPMGRMAESREIADVVIFLGCDAASYITGQNIIVDGGLTAW